MDLLLLTRLIEKVLSILAFILDFLRNLRKIG